MRVPPPCSKTNVATRQAESAIWTILPRMRICENGSEGLSIQGEHMRPRMSFSTPSSKISSHHPRRQSSARAPKTTREGACAPQDFRAALSLEEFPQIMIRGSIDFDRPRNPHPNGKKTKIHRTEIAVIAPILGQAQLLLTAFLTRKLQTAGCPIMGLTEKLCVFGKLDVHAVGRDHLLHASLAFRTLQKLRETRFDHF
jgi:hypothetical protein